MSKMVEATKMVEASNYGPEPSWGVQEPSQSQIMKALNWYNYMSDPSDHKKWILEYAKKSPSLNTLVPVLTDIEPSKMELRYADIRTNNKYLEYGFRTGVFARLFSLGAKLPPVYQDALETTLRFLCKREGESATGDKKTTLTRKTVQENLDSKILVVLSDIESKIDDILLQNPMESLSYGGKKSKKNINVETPGKKFISSYTLKGVAAKKIGDFVADKIKEFEKNSQDYSQDKNNMAYLIQFLSDVQTECNTIVEIAKTTKNTVRKTRAKSPIDIVKRLKYMVSSDTYNIKSIAPSKIIGADKLIVYNVVKAACTIYEAKTSVGLSVKGTTILGYDETKSATKKVRKPSEFLKTITNASGIRVIKNAFNDLTTKESKPNGRMNSDTILLGVY